MNFNPAARRRTVLCMLLAITSLSGCKTFCQQFPWCPVCPPACQLPPNPSLSQVVDHLNRNVVASWRSTYVRIRARGVPVQLSAVIAVESPRNVRLIAKSPVGNEVDLGSNSQRFWVWVKRNKPKAIVTVAHEQLDRARQRGLQVPFQPDWLMEALGVIPIDASNVTMQRSPSAMRRLQLIAKGLSTDNRPVRKVIVVDTCYGRVLEQSLYDESSGKLIAQAVFGDHRSDPVTGVVLPHRIDLSWPQAGMALTMHLGRIEVNPGRMPEQTWKLPTIRDYPILDLGR